MLPNKELYMKYTYEDIDERIVKTKLALTEALIDLIKENGKVNVLTICQKAKVTAMTYYHHFANKQQLVEYTINQQLKGFLPIPKKLKPINIKHFVYYLINGCVTLVNRDNQLISSIIANYSNDEFKHSFFFLAINILNKLIQSELYLLNLSNPIYLEMWGNIIFGSLLSICIRMIQTQYIWSAKQMWGSIKMFASTLI